MAAPDPSPFVLKPNERCVYFKKPTEDEVHAKYIEILNNKTREVPGSYDLAALKKEALNELWFNNYNQFPRKVGSRICFLNNVINKDEIGIITNFEREDYPRPYIITVRRSDGSEIALSNELYLVPPHGRIVVDANVEPRAGGVRRKTHRRKNRKQTRRKRTRS